MKSSYYLILFLFGINLTRANTVTPALAQKVAENFYKQHSAHSISSVNLAYTAVSEMGVPVYYAFNINANDGFVLITANDGLRPVIGYSTEKKFVVPGKNTMIAYWLNKRKEEIQSSIVNNLQTDKRISNEWAHYTNPTNVRLNTLAATMSTQSVTPLVQSTWDQSPYYNDSCPNNSVTGCVATAMAQIMRYWNYPLQGKDTASYCDCTANGFSDNFGVQSVNFGTTIYNWADMPLSVATTNTAVAQLMYHCGVSIHMDYDPQGSNGELIVPESPYCSQIAFPKYFNYNPYTINGILKNNYSDTAWMQFILTDLYAGRPIEYAGGDHCWVLDGYDGDGNVHMNWGWSGEDNGFYPLSNLNLGAGPDYDFTQGQEAIFGIQPWKLLSTDAGIQSINTPMPISCTSSVNPVVTLLNFGSSTLTSCTINYQVDANSPQTIAWSGSLDSTQSTTVSLGNMNLSSGTHTLTCYTSKPNATTDGDSLNDRSVIIFYTGTTGQLLPLSQGFETSNNLPSGWALNNSLNYGNWMVTNRAAKTGVNTIAYDNAEGNGDGNMTGQSGRFYIPGYDFTNAAFEILTFDVAYAPATKQGSNTVLNDTLAVYYSPDCGTTWNNLYTKGGSKLATATTFHPSNSSAADWAPTSTQWRTESINLSAVAGMPDVMFAFENRSDWGNWLFIDNINILTSTGIDAITSENNLSVYPNPATNQFTMEGKGMNGNLQYTLYDVTGRELKKGEIKTEANGFTQTISTDDLMPGVFFIKVADAKNTWVKKLSIQ
jgi:hypothetical protein